LEVFRISHNDRYSRFAGYQFAQASDRESWVKGYELLKRAYDKEQRPPSVIDELKNLEDRLNTPPQQRIPDARPQMEIQHGEVGPTR
jgi:hypothetical protein